MNIINFSFLLSLFAITVFGQEQKIITSDIDNFWSAYDSIQKVTEKPVKIEIINSLYIKKGTPGLRAFMNARNYSAELYIDLIEMYPKFWKSVRSNTLSVKKYTPQIESSIIRFTQLYPEIKDAKMYFTIGGLRSGGTVDNGMVLIGTEIAAADSLTDVSEFRSNWLPGVFKKQSIENLVYLNVHEFVHTQQTDGESILLGGALKEGACDFIAELVLNHPISRNYLDYGRLHEREIREKFKREMFNSDFSDWLGNGENAKDMADLGYFMGYTICKSFYDKVENKKEAIKKIIELDYGSENSVEDFLVQSGYYKEGFDKKSLLENFEKSQPEITGIRPITNGDQNIDSSVAEISITFSKPMGKGVSINYGSGGKETFPITGIKGWSDDKTTLILNVKLKSNTDYNFIVTPKSFRSIEGIKLKGELPFSFKTK